MKATAARSQGKERSLAGAKKLKQQAQKRQGGSPEGSGGVDNIQSTVAKAGLPVCAPLWLLLVAVASWVAGPCAVPISLNHQSAGELPICIYTYM